jgi:hypothetical protein
MFYEEKLINDRLWCRSTPNGEWRPVTIEALTNRLVAAEKALSFYREAAHDEAERTSAPEEVPLALTVGGAPVDRNAAIEAVAACTDQLSVEVYPAIDGEAALEWAKRAYMNNGGAPQDSEMPTSGLKGKQGADPADASPPPQLPRYTEEK